MTEEQFKSYNEVIEGLKGQLVDVTKASEEIRKIAKNQAEEIDALKSPAVPDVRRHLSKRQQLEILVANAFKSEEFDRFESKGYAGETCKMTLGGKDKIELHRLGEQSDKTVVPITGHTGTVMISEISDMLRDDTPIRNQHIRDLINVRPTSAAQIVAGQVYSYTDALTLGALIVAENTEASESSFLSKENTWSVKRIVHSFRLSKRWFKVNGLQWVIDHVLSKLPDAMFTVEDFEFLFGDGSGNHVVGLTDVAQTFDLTYAAYTTGDFSSVATWNGGVQSLVTFAAAHGIKNGDNLILANTPTAAYDGTHTAVEVVNATQVVIDKAYTAQSTAAWTGSATSVFYLSVEHAQELDVLKVAASLLKAGEFMPTGHIVNVQTQTALGLLKDTTDNYLNIQKDANDQVIGVGGLPLVAITAMPAGKYLTGDFSPRAVEIRELTPFNIQFITDSDTAKKNEIMLVVEEEIIFPVYNPYWFIYGKFSTDKAQLETASS
jgi:HK97 family phage major capsid protein